MNKQNEIRLRVHRILRDSRANGPGLRSVLWFQGCSVNCPGCFNPETHDPNGGKLLSVTDCVTELLGDGLPPKGITFSGGEPFQQKAGLLTLLRELRRIWNGNILIFSGSEYEVLKSDPICAECLSLCDALICGPYRLKRPPDYERFCSSSNQRLILLSERLHETDFQCLPLNEILITREGDILQSGLTGIFLRNG